uniref:Ovule protein n=1 Tax=Ascaris lumbricoides TaxID=6252 RepID=A0A0M3HUE0_ASCLU
MSVFVGTENKSNLRKHDAPSTPQMEHYQSEATEYRHRIAECSLLQMHSERRIRCHRFHVHLLMAKCKEEDSSDTISTLS